MILISRQGEARLVETLSDITAQREHWQVMVYNLSQLLEEYKSDYQLRIAMNLAHDLLQALDGGIYLCTNGDMAILVRHLNPQLARKLSFQLRYLYMDDPLAYDASGDENPLFHDEYALDVDYDVCFQRFSKQMVKAERGGKPAVKAEAKSSVLQLFNASRMASVEQELSKLDISKALRRQAVCAFTNQVQLRRVFEETYIHIPHLRELLKVNVDFLSNQWLFKYMTQLLDMRMLDMLKTQKSALLASPVSININAQTLLSDSFLAFDQALDATQKVAVIFEIPVVDAFADSAAFMAACKQAQQRGYRVCLDGLNETSFLQIAPLAFKVDLIKLQWGAGFDTDAESGEKDKLRKAIENTSGKRIILCRCDSEEAIQYGKSLGVSLFQGRWLDQQLQPGKMQAN